MCNTHRLHSRHCSACCANWLLAQQALQCLLCKLVACTAGTAVPAVFLTDLLPMTPTMIHTRSFDDLLKDHQTTTKRRLTANTFPTVRDRCHTCEGLLCNRCRGDVHNRYCSAGRAQSMCCTTGTAVPAVRGDPPAPHPPYASLSYSITRWPTANRMRPTAIGLQRSCRRGVFVLASVLRASFVGQRLIVRSRHSCRVLVFARDEAGS